MYFAASDKEMFGLFRALGHPEWADDERFDTAAKRQEIENFEALGALLHRAFLEISTEEIMRRLVEEEVPAAEVNSIDDVFTDPQVVHNEAIVEWEHPDAGLVKMAKPPVRWGTTQPEVRWSADHLGQSTVEVLSEHGYGADALATLRDSGAILP